MYSPHLQSDAEGDSSLPGGGGGSRQLRVLLVEDYADTRLSMEILLRRNYHVQSVGSAREALALAEKETFDVAITDIGLPDMNGVELMKRLHESSGLQAIAISGYGGGDEETPQNGAAFIHHLTKPFSMDQLRALLSDLQAQKDAGPASPG